MTNQDPDVTKPQDTAQFAANPQPFVTLSTESLDLPDPGAKTTKTILYVGIGVVALIIVASLLLALQVTKSTKTPTNSPSGIPSSEGPAQSPLNTNSSIKSQEQYCSTEVNAALNC